MTVIIMLCSPIKRAVINDEPLIERVVTLTGDKISFSAYAQSQPHLAQKKHH